MSRVKTTGILVGVAAFLLTGVSAMLLTHTAYAATWQGPMKFDNTGVEYIRNGSAAAYGDSYPNASRQMEYVVSYDDFTRINQTDILVYMPTRYGTIQIVNKDLCVNTQTSIANSDANYAPNMPAGTPATEYRLIRPDGVSIRFAQGYWDYSGAGACATHALNMVANSPLADSVQLDPDTGMYKYRIRANAVLGGAGGEFANGFKIVAPAGSYISQDSNTAASSFGLQPSYPIPGNNPVTPNPPNPFRVYTDIDIPFGPDCSLAAGISRRETFDIYDADNNGNYDVQPQPFSVQLLRHNRATGAYIGTVDLNLASGAATQIAPIANNVWRPTGASQATTRFSFTANGSEIYKLRIYNLYYDNTLQFKIPFDNIFFFRQCQTALTSTVRPNVTLSPDIAMPGQTLTGTSSITYVGAMNSPAQVDARRLVWSDTNRNGRYDAGERIHVDDRRNGLTIPAGGFNFPAWSAAADPAIYGSRVCLGVFLTNPSPTTRTTPVPPNDIECSEIARKPKLQVWGGDIRVRGTATTPGKIETSVSPFDANQYGSWGEYGVIATGSIAGFASGSGLNNGTPSQAFTWNLLTFANRDNAGAASYGSFTLPPSVALSAQFMAAPSAGAPNSNLGSLASGTYNTANLTINASTIGQQAGKGKKIVIRATGTVTITGDITYQGVAGDTFNNINQIPQVVIIANKIDIRGSAGRIDAWLLTTGATGAINTCIDVALAAPLNSTICPNRLTVNGPVETAHLYLRRTGGSGSTAATAGDPAEVFNLRGDAYVWGRTQAAQNGKAQTVYSKELPPRF